MVDLGVRLQQLRMDRNMSQSELGKALNRLKLLTEAAFTGTLPTDTLSVELTVVNARTFTMPETGAISGAVLRVLGLAAAISCLCMLSVLSRKRH